MSRRNHKPSRRDRRELNQPRPLPPPANLSTGPRTEEGKARSSENSLKHGLASSRIIIRGEQQEDFDRLLSTYRDHYGPENPVEETLVLQLAEFQWLRNRAIRLQTEAFDRSPDGTLPKELALLIRYQTSNERGFHKTLDTLAKLQKEQAKTPTGFVSQNDDSAGDPATHQEPDEPLNGIDSVPDVIELPPTPPHESDIQHLESEEPRS